MFDFDRIGYNDLERILMYAANKLIDSLDEWKALLPLLGVCQQWSRILYPVVFYKAFIDYTGYSGVFSARRNGCKSNIDCMAIRRCYNVVRSLEIRIDIPADELLVLHNLVKLLKLGKVDWSQIGKLSIEISGRFAVLPGATPIKIEASIVDFAKRLIIHMPNIIDLQIIQYHEGYALQSLSQALVNAYSLQLKRLKLLPVVTLPTLDFGSSLTFLDLRLYNDYDYDYNLSVFSDTLRFLQLTCLPFNTPWYMFRGNSRRGLIKFKNLYKLVIKYHQVEFKNKAGKLIEPSQWYIMPKADKLSRKRLTSIADTDYRYKILFPKLKVLVVKNCYEEPDVINAEFDSTLDIFDLHGNLENIEKWSAIQLKSQRFRIIPESLDNKITTADIEIFNMLFSKSGNHCVKDLLFLMKVSNYHISLISWHYLNGLDVSLFDIAQLLDLLPRIPRLTKLKCRAFNKVSTTMSTDKVNDLFELYIDTLGFDIQLEEFYLSAGNNLPNDYTYLAIVYNFITRAKMLTRLTVPKHILSTAQEIIDTQKAAYPHFANIFVDYS